MHKQSAASVAVARGYVCRCRGDIEKYQGRTEVDGREMGSAVTYTYSPELQTDSGQILRIRGARLELIANVWLATWISG